MPVRLATYNVENLFSRPKVMNQDGPWSESREVLEDVSVLAGLIAKEKYTVAVQEKIKALLDKYDIGNRNRKPASRPFQVHEVRERLFTVPSGGTKVKVVATGRASWVGWVELTRMDLPGEQVMNTGRVISAMAADVLLLVEVEDRLTLDRFNRQVLGEQCGASYAFDLAVDGNDPRGIDLGLLSRFPVESVRTHIHDEDEAGRVFSRDCPEYEVTLPGGETLWVLGNHFKSKGYGAPAASNARRERQARQVKAIYEAARERSELVLVAGDLNDHPQSAPLAPLLAGTDLRDAMANPRYVGSPGTYGTGNPPTSKIDYLLLSPALWDRVTAVGVERRGVWAPNTFASFPEVTKLTAGSDHAGVWVDLGG